MRCATTRSRPDSIIRDPVERPLAAGSEDGETDGNRSHSVRSSSPASAEPACAYHRAARLSWARLLKRVFAIDLEQCPNCGGELKIIAAIIDAPVIERILTHLGLCARAPPRSPAQAPALLHAA